MACPDLSPNPLTAGACLAPPPDRLRRQAVAAGLAWTAAWGLGLGAPAPPAVAAEAPSAGAGTIAQAPRVRVIVDNDFAGDPDGLFALAHQWLSPSARTVLVSCSPLNPRLAALSGKPAGRTAALGRDRALALAGQLGADAPCPVLVGAESFGAGSQQISSAAEAIVAEALRPDPLPLLLACGGPLTNVAAALRLAPEIAPRLQLLWIGGALGVGQGEPAEPEYNLAQDMAAARQVLCQPGLAVRVVPRDTYRQLRVSVAELGAQWRPISPLADWLYQHCVQLPPFVRLGPTVTLGDSGLLHLGLLAPDAPLRPVRADALWPPGADVQPAGQWLSVGLCESIDTRTLWADLLGLLRLQAAQRVRA